MSDTSHTQQASTKTKRAGAFDIRTIIGALLSIYGAVLLLMGIFDDVPEDKTGGVNANLWAGLALLVAGLGFMAWARLKPIVVPDDIDRDEVEPPAH